MTEQEMIETLAKLQMLCVNYVERNTSLRIEDTRSFDRLIQRGTWFVPTGMQQRI